ncbi:MAG: hypothetical protein JWM80_5072 [Cyanobacteria bacterium RYN_339]|nr:hypothetical protein [Cyanobacteria bacterium RYN_339]
MLAPESFLMCMLMAIAVYVAYAKVAAGPDDPFAGLLPEGQDDPDEAWTRP